uniref:Uncharacterized protein n=1 Tax=Clandestinovirus TaxID=2831644 RepID=A0A8F8KPH3_9VIRU|nr:hypothetical protein KOM_12_613 [Clandestinovirus]
MSFQYKTIHNLIEALRNQQPDLAFEVPYSLEKINVKFVPKAGFKWDQKPNTVQWDSEEFNNLNITGKRTDSGSCATVGELLAMLQKFALDHQGKAYSITCQQKLLDDDIVGTRPYFKVNDIPWEKTTLVDAHIAANEVVEHLNSMLGSSPWDHATNGSAFEFVQAYVKNHPKVPTGLTFSVYLVPNGLVDKTMCGYKVFASLSAAKKHIVAIEKDRIQIGTTIVNILNSAKLFVPISEKTPNVLVFNTALVDEVKNKMAEVDKQLANLSM